MSYPDSLPRAERRARGVYYTPEAVVAHVAEATLRPLSARRAPRVLDPAAGDGGFLRVAARLLPRACLFGLDLDPRAIAMARGVPRAQVACGDALGEMPIPFHRAPGFDAVVGNPPWGAWDRGLGRRAKEGYRNRFTTARGRLDPFALFIERATTLLRPGGRLGFVLPDIFLLKNYPAARLHVLDNYIIEELVHWGRCFPGVNLDVCSIVAMRRPARGRAQGRARGPLAGRAHDLGVGHGLVRCLPDGPGGRVAVIAQSTFKAAPGHAFNLALEGKAAALLARLEREGVPLGRWLEAHEGVHSGNMRARLFLPPGVAAPRGARPAAIRPLLFGRDEIAPFVLRPGGWRIVYDRGFVRRDRGEYANLGRAEWHAAPKLMVRRTGDRVVAALDSRGLAASNNLFVARRRPGCPVPLAYLEGYLNSPLATWCFRARVPRAGRLFAELKLAPLRALPVPCPDDRRLITRIAALAERARRGDARAPALLDAAVCTAAGLSHAERDLLDSVRKAHL